MKTNCKSDTRALLTSLWVVGCIFGCSATPSTSTATAAETTSDAQAMPDDELARLRQERREFQAQELATADPFVWLFPPKQPPRIIWRDVDKVRSLGGNADLRVRWFDAELNEVELPERPGRYGAWIEGVAPNGTPLRRALTFFAVPKDFLENARPEIHLSLSHFPGSPESQVWREHQAEFEQVWSELLLRSILSTEAGAIYAAGMHEAKPLGRPARYAESAATLNDEYHLALKFKLQGLDQQIRPLSPPRRRNHPATVLRAGTPEEAGVRPDAKERIDAVCRAWAEDSGEPFVTLVARRGVIVTHEAFGCDKSGKPVDLDYRCWVASITKSVTALLFSQFVDQGRIRLDDPISAVFPDYPKCDPHVPTFRQCFNHTSGLEGHGDFGGMRNPHLENIVLNGIDVNEPGTVYRYCGMGFELAAKAMEIMTGKCAVRLFDEQFFRPLGLGDVPMGNASSDGRFTAMELAILAQWVANRGSYGDLEFISPETFEQLLPRPLEVPEHGFTEDEGIGLHWTRMVRAGAPKNSKQAEDLLFSLNTLGHGSFSGCIFVIDLDNQIVIAQARAETGPRSEEWRQRFFETVAEVTRPANKEE
ncbi:MAG: serine hydrolase domain-containing protein [Planctomycetota bacterium]